VERADDGGKMASMGNTTMSATSGSTLWQQKRLQLAGDIKQERLLAEASRHTFQHERAEKNRRLHKQESAAHRPGQERQQKPRHGGPAYGATLPTLSTFSGVCSTRRSAPQAQPVTWDAPRSLGGSHGGGTEKSLPFPESSARSMQAAAAGYGMSYGGNAKWLAAHEAGAASNVAPAFHTAPDGFPLRKVAAGQRAGGGAGGDTREWAGLAATISDNRSELDRLLLERVALLAQAGAPKPKKKIPGAPRQAKKKNKENGAGMHKTRAS